MQPQAPIPEAPAPQQTSFEAFKNAIDTFNDSSQGVSNRVGAYQASQVQPNFQYQQDVAARNAALSLANKAAKGEGFQKVPKADGGFDFIDPYGKKLTVHQYAMATGTDPVKALADSNNSRDRQFVTDYNHVQTLANGLINNDRASVDKVGYQLFGDHSKNINDSANKTILDNFYKDLHNNYPNGDRLIQGFMQYYPEVYSDLSTHSQPHALDQLPNYTSPTDPQKFLGLY